MIEGKLIQWIVPCVFILFYYYYKKRKMKNMSPEEKEKDLNKSGWSDSYDKQILKQVTEINEKLDKVIK